jgi:hypothetical protein
MFNTPQSDSEISIPPPHISHPLEEHCNNSKNTTFQERGITIGQGDAITSKEQHFSPLMAILENRCVTVFHSVNMVSGIPLEGITQNERFS